MAELADAPDLGSGGEIRVGSNPTMTTIFKGQDMFIEVDVVEFNDKDIPYITIMLNMNSIAQFQPIAKRHREAYTAGRDAAIQKQLTDPNVRVSAIEELPNSGAIMLIAGNPSVLYTVTPYSEVRDAILKLQNTAT